MSNGEFLIVRLDQALTVKDYNRASQYHTIEEAQNDLEFLAIGDMDIRFNPKEVEFEKFMIIENSLKELEAKEVMESKELLHFWEENERMEDWHGHDGHDARHTLYVIEEVLKHLNIKVKGINDQGE